MREDSPFTPTPTPLTLINPNPSPGEVQLAPGSSYLWEGVTLLGRVQFTGTHASGVSFYSAVLSIESSSTFCVNCYFWETFFFFNPEDTEE